MSAWRDSMIPMLVDQGFATFGEPVHLQAGGVDLEITGIYSTQATTVGAGEPIPQPRVQVRVSDLGDNSPVGGRVKVREKWRSIVRSYDNDDGTVDLELGMRG